MPPSCLCLACCQSDINWYVQRSGCRSLDFAGAALHDLELARAAGHGCLETFAMRLHLQSIAFQTRFIVSNSLLSWTYQDSKLFETMNLVWIAMLSNCSLIDVSLNAEDSVFKLCCAMDWLAMPVWQTWQYLRNKQTWSHCLLSLIHILTLPTKRIV